MTEADTRSTKELFRSWRQGDAAAGQAMAQRFADWYYAIATSRLGESSGREPCENACNRFGQGIVQVKEPRSLVGWAHDIIQEELASRGERAADGNEPNAYTGNQPPKALLAAARSELPEEIRLLELVYAGGDSREIAELAEPMGGMPLGVLRARYAVKRWLRDHRAVPFEVAPDEPNLDRAPLPLYESGSMATDKEQVNFEHWMLSDIDLCRDIAEFAHFAIALRGGLDSGAEPTGGQVVTADDRVPSEGAGRRGLAATGGLAVVGIVLAVLLVLVLLVVVIGASIL